MRGILREHEPPRAPLTLAERIAESERHRSAALAAGSIYSREDAAPLFERGESVRRVWLGVLNRTAQDLVDAGSRDWALARRWVDFDGMDTDEWGRRVGPVPRSFPWVVCILFGRRLDVREVRRLLISGRWLEVVPEGAIHGRREN